MNSSLKIASLIIISFITARASFAQILNIDQTDTEAYAPKAVWRGTVSLGMEVDKQKSTLFDASNFADMSLQQSHELYIVSAANRFTYNGPNDFLNAGYVHLRWRHGYKDRWHPESYVQYQWDNGRGIVGRYLAGENVRFNIQRRDTWQMSLATGLLYENETWDYVAVDSAKIPPHPVNQHTSNIKSNNYVKGDLKVSSNSSLSVTIYYQALFNHFFQPRIATNIDYLVTVSKHFLLNAKFSSLYDAAPVVPIFQFYYNFSYSLVYKF